ncbi:MAG TPA: hypothetical protein VEI97_14340, partial [bacterium]|nr:hypothetical protein [bacterium]
MTARVGLVGFPLAHSLSPLLHRTLYRLAGIDATYDLWEFPPEAFPADFGSQVKGGWQGLNVTTPHKEAVIPHCDVLSEGAGAIGAVNHLWVDPRGRLVGDNKDIDGAYFTLQGIAAANPAWPIARFQEMHLIGLGPAARAVVLGFHRFWRAERARLKRPPGQDPGRGVVVVYLRDIRPEHHGWLERLAPDLTDDVALVGLKPLTVLDDGDASGLLVH